MNKDTENIVHKKIAVELAREMDNDRDINCILNSKKIFDILEHLNSNEKSHIAIHENLDGSNIKDVEKLEENKQYLFDNLLKVIRKNVLFDVELVKHGKGMSCRVNRYAIIIYPEGLWSMKTPLSENKVFNKSLAKDKTRELEMCEFSHEELGKEKTGWDFPEKKFRLRLTFKKIDKNENDFIYLYFKSEEDRTTAENLLRLIKLKKKESQIIPKIQNMQKIIEGSNITYSITKILKVYDSVKHRKILLLSLKKEYDESADNFLAYMKKSAANLVERYRSGKSSTIVVEKQVERSTEEKLIVERSTVVVKKQKFSRGMITGITPQSYEHSKPTNFFSNEEDTKVSEDGYKSLTTYRKAINSISNSFPEFFRKKKSDTDKKENSDKVSNKEKAFKFVLDKVEVKTEINTLNQLSKYKHISIDKFNPSIDFIESKEEELNNQTDVKKIEKGEIVSLDGNYLRNMTSVFINSDLKSKYCENSIVINGPKLDIKKYISYQFRNHSINNNRIEFNSSDKFVEPEKSRLSYSQSFGANFKAFYVQVFQIYVKFSKEDLEELKIKSSSNKDIDPLKDLLYFIEFSVLGNKYKTRSAQLTATKFLEESGLIMIEVNNEFLFNNESLLEFADGKLNLKLLCVPEKCFDIKCKKEKYAYLLNYTNYLTLGSLMIDTENYDNSIYYLQLLKNKKSVGEILLNLNNFFYVNPDKNYERFVGSNFPVNSDILLLDEITKEKIDKFVLSKDINDGIKNEFKEFKYTSEGEILLRFPTERELLIEGLTNDQLVKALKDSGVRDDIIDKMYLNQNNKILPYIQKFDRVYPIDKGNKEDVSTLKSSDNLLLTRDEINKQIQNNKEKFIYKIPLLRKYFNTKFKGVSNSQNMVFYNHSLNNLTIHSISQLRKNSEMYNIPVIRNPYTQSLDLFDFYEIENSSLENTDNHRWKICLKFKNAIQQNVFLKYLNRIKEQSFISTTYGDLSSKYQANKHLTNKLLIGDDSENKTSERILNIGVHFLEFRQIFNLEETSNFEIKVTKLSRSIVNKSSKNSILENLNKDKYGYSNSFFKSNQELKDSLNSFKTSEIVSETIVQTGNIKSNDFNKSHKILKFDPSNNIVNLDVNPGIDKAFLFEVIVNGVNGNSITLSKEVNLSSIINSNPVADIIYVPIFNKSENIKENNNLQNTMSENSKLKDVNLIKAVLIINCHVASTTNNNNTDFENEFNKTLKFVKEPKDKYNNYIVLGRFEPNVYRRELIKEIQDLFKTDFININSEFLSETDKREKLCGFLSDKCVVGAVELSRDSNSKLWTLLSVDVDEHHLQVIRKFYENYKRNEFYYQFTDLEWNHFLNNVYDKIVEKKTHSFNEIDQYSILPSKLDFQKLKSNKSELFLDFRSLCYLGIPLNKRQFVWDKLLDINNLINKTFEVLKDKKECLEGMENRIKNITEIDEDKFNSKKVEFYDIFESKVNKHTNYDINFSLIDKDISNLLKIGDSKEENISDMQFRNNIKLIAKSYFLWTDLNIVTESQEKNIEKKYVYFYGILQIIQRLYSINKSKAITFWTLCGLSQFLEMFYQENSLLSNEMAYNKIYVLVTKLILSSSLKPLFDKLNLLNFPIEFFFFPSISSLFADLFHTELFLRILDVLILESTIKTEKLDKFNYLRFLCVIPITLMELNQSSIMACKTTRELETVLIDCVRKTFNTEFFIQSLKENVSKFFYQNSGINKYVDDITKKTETQWDKKRDKLSKLINNMFSTIENENNSYLMKLQQTNLTLTDSKLKNFENKIFEELDSIRAIYGQGTPTGKDKVHGVLLCFSKLFIYNKSIKMMGTNNKFYLNIYFSDEKPKSSVDYKNTMRETIEINEDGEILNCSVKEYQFDLLKQYAIISLFTFSKDRSINPEFFSSFALNLNNIDIMRPIKHFVESNDRFNKTKIELGIFKYSKVGVSTDRNLLFRSIFTQPQILYSNKVFNEIHEISEDSISDIGAYNTCIRNEDSKILKKFVQSSFFTEKEEQLSFQETEFIRHNIELFERFKFSSIVNKENNDTFNFERFAKTMDLSELKKLGRVEFLNKNEKKLEKLNLDELSEENKKLFINLQNILLTIYSKEQTEIVIDWLRSGETTLEEVLFSSVLVDTSSVTIQDKLKLLFDFASLQNKLIYNKEMINEEKLKNVIYSLYKRFMINFTKNDSDRMIDYILSRENLHNIPQVILFNDEDYSKIQNLLKTEVNINSPSLNKKIKDISRSFNLGLSMLKNQFDIAFLTKDLLNLLISKIISENSIDIKNSNLLIEIFNESIKTSMCSKIETDKNGVNINLQSDNRIISYDTNVENKYFAELIVNIVKQIEIYNNESAGISYDVFCNIIFKLPFLGDLIRNTCAYSKISHSSQYFQEFDLVKLEVFEPNSKYNLNILIGLNLDPYKYKSNEKEKIVLINQKIYNTTSFADLINDVCNYLNNNNQSNLTKFLYNATLQPNDYVFEVVKSEGLTDNFDIFDSLYSSHFIRRLDFKKQLNLRISSGLLIDASFLSDNNQKKSNFNKLGYAMLTHLDRKGFYWFECLLKDPKDKDEGGEIHKITVFDNTKRRVKLCCLENKFKFTLPSTDSIYDYYPIVK